MKMILTNGISYLEPLEGGQGWYWGSDYVHGDLYEAQELFRNGHAVSCNRLVFVHHPSGQVVEPIRGREGQYFGRPLFWEGRFQILFVDFSGERICIHQYDPSLRSTAGGAVPVVSLPLDQAEDCYNLMLHRSPLMLTRQPVGCKFQILWPQRVEFEIGGTENFVFREGDLLFFSRWFECPDIPVEQYEVVVRGYPAGEIRNTLPGSLLQMPDGQHWILR